MNNSQLFNYTHGSSTSTDDGSQVEAIKIYGLSNYYFYSKPAPPLKNQTLEERISCLKTRYDVCGIRTCVEAVILVELSKTPQLLLLQLRNSTYKLPGGRLRPDIEGLKRKLTNKLSVHSDGILPDWEVGECLGRWWRVGFETLLLPYLPPNVRSPKECRKIFLVKLPERQKFTVPKTHKLLAVPLSQLHENHEIYGPVISGVPQLLSKFPIETASR
ncbi:pre-mRNA cleavage factor Im 25 kDa subunit 1 isoform X2 [Daucus carota subsp. sativus]|uniref:Pre-mRNA cleavage factor Im 25 kDa subunit n=1 Tax=Daucus carota subsp. sativus TaxID=79200 RepID=A0A175YM04_DAUCS